MKSIMITGSGSGSGKTTVSMGLIRVLKNRGYNVGALKTGPDYIDTAYLREVSGRESGNLDMHLQGRKGIKEALSLIGGDICVIEGAMGYFDGIYNTYNNSSYDISKELDINCILVYSPKGEMFSAVPKIKGMAEFEGSKIKGIILNKINRHYYLLLKEQLERYTDLKVLGFIPEMVDGEIKSRHLGLIQSIEMESLSDKIQKIAEVMEKSIDIDALIRFMDTVETREFPKIEKRNIRVAIAKDKAFSFYYNENIKLFENTCEVTYFSPLTDNELPDCDLLILGGGYPEVFREELTGKRKIMKKIKGFAQMGGCIYAECGGFMYLNEWIEGSKMVGIFSGKSMLTERLQRFGYIDILLKIDCMLGKKGDKLQAHEFHKSISEIKGQGIFDIGKTMGNRKWECGYQYKNVLAGYPHINFLGNLRSFEYMLDYVEGSRGK